MPTNQRHTFTAVIQASGGGAAYAEVPFDVEEVFGDKRPQVKVTIEGETYVWRLIRAGTPFHTLGVPKGIREKSGKNFGDTIEITVEADNAVRDVAVPADFTAALAAEPSAKEFFETLSPSHRKEFVRWISEAKKDQARARRVEQAIQMLNEKQIGV